MHTSHVHSVTFTLTIKPSENHTFSDSLIAGLNNHAISWKTHRLYSCSKKFPCGWLRCSAGVSTHLGWQNDIEKIFKKCWGSCFAFFFFSHAEITPSHKSKAAHSCSYRCPIGSGRKKFFPHFHWWSVVKSVHFYIPARAVPAAAEWVIV